MFFIKKFTKEQWMWSLFDWGNSAYALVITSTVFPIYFMSVTQYNNGYIQLGGLSLKNASVFSFTLSAGFLSIAIVSPILSGIADSYGYRKSFMQFFTLLGSFSCIGLFFFDAQHIIWGIICFYLSIIGYSGGIVFNNSFLPEIANTSDQNSVSALGFAMGYLGSVILQLIILLIITYYVALGISESLAVRIGFVLVGIWWLGLAQFTYFHIKEIPDQTQLSNNKNILTSGYFKLLKSIRLLYANMAIRKFIMAYFFYTCGVQTVMFLATLFGEEVIRMNDSELITTIFVIQLLGIFGAYIASQIAQKLANIIVLLFILLLWIATCIITYTLVITPLHFILVAILVGLIMGAIQSLSRSTYSQLLPLQADTASQFSVYDVTEKLAIVTGTFCFGVVTQWTGDIRKAILPIIIFFIIGGIFLLTMKKR